MRAARDTSAREARDTTARTGRDTTARRGAAAGGESAEGEIDQELLGDVLTAMRRANIPTRGGFGRGGPPAVESGDYLVTLVAGGKTLHQVLRVERTANAPGGQVRTENEDDDDLDLVPQNPSDSSDPSSSR
jgi:hypothetical protein